MHSYFRMHCPAPLRVEGEAGQDALHAHQGRGRVNWLACLPTRCPQCPAPRLQNGQLLSPKDAAAAPKVHIKGGSEGGLFTLLVSDPDPPGAWLGRCTRRGSRAGGIGHRGGAGCPSGPVCCGHGCAGCRRSPGNTSRLPCGHCSPAFPPADPANPVYREWLHWVVTNIPAGGEAGQGTEVCASAAPHWGALCLGSRASRCCTVLPPSLCPSGGVACAAASWGPLCRRATAPPSACRPAGDVLARPQPAHRHAPLRWVCPGRAGGSSPHACVLPPTPVSPLLLACSPWPVRRSVPAVPAAQPGAAAGALRWWLGSVHSAEQVNAGGADAARPCAGGRPLWRRAGQGEMAVH